jgi:hypothetical protein
MSSRHRFGMPDPTDMIADGERARAAYGLLRAAVALAVSVGPEHGEAAMACLRTALRECERRDGDE